MSRLQELAKILTHLESLSDKGDKRPLMSPLSLPTPRHGRVFSPISKLEGEARDRPSTTRGGSSSPDARDEKNTERAKNTGDKSDGRVVAGSTIDLPLEWIAGLASVRTMVCPATVRSDRWRKIVTDAGRFLDDWGAQAAVLGWGTLDLFGAHPKKPIERLDRAGLVILLHGDELVALTADAGRMRTRSGGLLTYYRRPLATAVPLWGLAVE